MSEHECIIGLLYKTDYAQLATVLGLKDHIEETAEDNNSFRAFGMDWMITHVWSFTPTASSASPAGRSGRWRWRKLSN
mgnify:CR=1 FL=1